MSSGGVWGGVTVDFYAVLRGGVSGHELPPSARAVFQNDLRSVLKSAPHQSLSNDPFVLFTQQAFWGVYEILDDGSFDFHCFSNENLTVLPYPVEATWICKSGG